MATGEVSGVLTSCSDHQLSGFTIHLQDHDTRKAIILLSFTTLSDCGNSKIAKLS